MTEYSSNFYSESNPRLIEKFEEMLKSRNSYFFDVEDIEFLVDYYIERGVHHKARKAAMHGLSLYPNSSALLLKQAHALLVGKKPVKALEILDYLEAAEPLNTEMLLFKAVVHRNLSDYEGTKSCLIKALNATSENKEDIYLDLAFEQEMVEDYVGAIQSLKQSLEINPEHEPSLFELGYCFDMAQELENGVDFFQDYVDNYPYSFVGWYNLALCFEKLSLFEKAIEAIEYCLVIKDDFVNAHILHANMLTSCDRDSDAIEAYNESLIHDSKNPMVFAAIGECYERLELWSLAEANYLEALRLDSKYVDALMGLGAVKDFENNYTESLSLYREALKYDELNMDNWHIYAELLEKCDKNDEAEEVYKKMIELFEDDEESWIALADVQAKSMGHLKALETLELGESKISDSLDIIWQKAKHLIKAGKLEHGTEMLMTALDENPKGCNYFISIFPESILIPNIAALLEIHTQAHSKDEL